MVAFSGLNRMYNISNLPLVFWAGLVLSWLFVIFVDMMNVGGLGDYLIEIAARDGSAFVMLFGEARPVEWMQWACLAGASMMAAQIGVVCSIYGNKKKKKFAYVMAIFFAILLMEDAGNLRHNISNTIVSAGIPQPFFPNFYRMVIYALYAALPIYAVVRYGSSVVRLNKMSAVFWGAFVVYALASVMSVFAPVNDFYEVIGEGMNDLLFSGRVIYDGVRFESGYWIMDLLVEESLELIGAIMFLTAFIGLRSEVLSNSPFDT